MRVQGELQYFVPIVAGRHMRQGGLVLFQAPTREYFVWRPVLFT
jgi:hypothetical protein